MMEDFIIRIYRFEKDNPRGIVGLIEKVGKKERIGFTSIDELWQFLNSSIRGEKREDDGGCIALKRKGGDGLWADQMREYWN